MSTYISLHSSIHIYSHVYAHVHTHVCPHVCAHVYTYVYTRVYIHVYPPCICPHTCLYTARKACQNLRSHKCTSTLWMCVWRIDNCMDMHIDMRMDKCILMSLLRLSTCKQADLPTRPGRRSAVALRCTQCRTRRGVYACLPTCLHEYPCECLCACLYPYPGTDLADIWYRRVTMQMSVHMDEHICMRVYALKHGRTHVYAHVYAYVYTHARACPYTCLCACIRIGLCTCLNTRLYAHA